MMTVKELKELVADLPDDMEVGVKAGVNVSETDVPEWDDLSGHQIVSGYTSDFSRVFLICIDREEDSVNRWRS